MSKDLIPLHIADTSKFARSLAAQLEKDATPGHLSLMNMLARAAGFRNFQHLRADAAAGRRIGGVETPDVDQRVLERGLQHFDEAGMMINWPAKRSVQMLCLWALWAQMPKGQSLTEKQVNAQLAEAHLFGDAALLRRSLVSQKLMSRNTDGSDYRRIEQAPDGTAGQLIATLSQRRKR